GRLSPGTTGQPADTSGCSGTAPTGRNPGRYKVPTLTRTSTKDDVVRVRLAKPHADGITLCLVPYIDKWWAGRAPAIASGACEQGKTARPRPRPSYRMAIEPRKAVIVAQKIQTLFIDDIDGGEAEGTVRFALDGAEYEIDLSAKHSE